MKGKVESMTAGQMKRRNASKYLATLTGPASGTIASVVLILALWHISAIFVPEYIFPSISQVSTKLFYTITGASSYDAISYTLKRILGGFFLSAIVGVLLGVVMATSRVAFSLTMPMVKIISSVPALTWVLLSIVWFQSTETRVWFIMFILVFPIVATTTYDGVRSVPADLYQMIKAMRPSKTMFLQLLIIPSAMPFIFSGLKVSLSFGGRIAVFAEALSASTGIGAEMYMMNQTFDTAGIIVWTIILIATLSTLDLVLTLIESRWFRWRTDMHQ